MRRFQAGSVVRPFDLLTIHSKRMRVPDPHLLVHLQFRRFAGCPVCSLHLQEIVQKHSEILAASILEVVIFHSETEQLLRYAGELPLAVIADPNKRLYAEFGVESRRRALLDPRSWMPIARGVFRSLRGTLRGEPLPPLNPQGGRLGLPADFLIASDGSVMASHYGSNAYDQWSVEELIALSRSQ